VNVAVPLVPQLLRSESDRNAHAARLSAPVRMSQWASERRDPSRPLAWFHAPSVGEGLQATAVLGAFRKSNPDFQLAYTHFSPSAESLATSVGADYCGYLPYDRRRDVVDALEALQPELLVFTKLDLWPELTLQAVSRGSKAVMVAGTVSPWSSRLKWPARAVTRRAYAVLDAVGAISEADGARMVQLGARPDRVSITGDPRVDSAIEVAGRAALGSDLLPYDDFAMIAGSTWPGDEDALLDAFTHVREQVPSARLVIVPHQPTKAHLERINREILTRGMPAPVRLDEPNAQARPPLIVVERTGVLASIYRSGSIAYVGGGFGSRGIHSVLEPAAASRPVIIGPHARGSRDAGMLATAGGLVRITSGEELAQQWIVWLTNEGVRRKAGTAARHSMDGDRGAAERSAIMLEALMR